MRIQRFPSVVARVPISLVFCLISFSVLLLAILAPQTVRYIALLPEYLSETGYLWTLLTYAVMPLSVLNLLLISTIVLLFGWHIEPVLGRVRYTILIAASALASGLAYVVLKPVPGSALGGGLFVASAVGIAFLCWSVPNRAQFKSGLIVFWILAVCWVSYTLWASPMSLSAVHLVAWLIGFAIAIGPTTCSHVSPNNALQATCEDARA
jgi:membrane associated rhomboid family serine protease